MACLIKFHDTKALRVVDVVTKYGRPTILCCLCSGFQALTQTCTIENIVAEHHRARLITNKLLAKRERLRKAIRRWLHLIRQVDAVMTAVTEQTFEIWQIRRCRDD